MDPDQLLEGLDLVRLDAARQLDPKRRSELGQYMTPEPVARFMASLFRDLGGSIDLLDAGAGIGSLTAAAFVECCRRDKRPSDVRTVSFEVDPSLALYLRSTVAACQAQAVSSGFHFAGEVLEEDFIRYAVDALDGGLFNRRPNTQFTHAILNPPYKKLNSDSEARHLLRRVGIETSNLYTAFLGLTVRLLAPGGELVAITPRSFCNGPYFRPFRDLFLAAMSIRRIHVFESRTTAFADDEVLQENIVIHAVKEPQNSRVVVSSSAGPDEDVSSRDVPFDKIVGPDDAERFIHVVPDEMGQQVAELYGTFRHTLADLRVSVSTGRVVDFRAKEHLRAEPGRGTAPLIYPTHFQNGTVSWPKAGKKPNGLVDCSATRDLWMPTGTYVLVKRFSSKEERRRVVAAVFEPSMAPGARIGFENHLNVFHANGAGLSPDLARGLAVFLNSTLVDTYFRQFNGHTQVNATDLRSLHFPSAEALSRIGKRVGLPLPDQDEADRLVEELLEMRDSKKSGPLQAKKKLDEALSILKDLGLPREQQNERSAYTLLALLDLKPGTPWSEAKAPLMGITPMMTFFSEHYGKNYAPNTRETVRRQTIHQFVQAGLVVPNPDKPARPVNSPKAVYQIEPVALTLLRTFGTSEWNVGLVQHLTAFETQHRGIRVPRCSSRAGL